MFSQKACSEKYTPWVSFSISKLPSYHKPVASLFRFTGGGLGKGKEKRKLSNIRSLNFSHIKSDSDDDSTVRVDTIKSASLNRVSKFNLLFKGFP